MHIFWCHAHWASHRYQQQELLFQMLVLALPFVALTEMHYDRWESICVKDKVLAYTRGAIKGLHKLPEGTAGMGRLLSLLPIKKNIPLLPNSARGAKGANFPCLSFRWAAPTQLSISHGLSLPVSIKTVINSSCLVMQGSGTVLSPASGSSCHSRESSQRKDK